MRSKGRGSVSSRTTRAGGSEVRTTTLKSSSITISPETFSGSFHILAQNGWGFPLMRRLPPRSKMSALIVCSRQCTSLRGQLESMAPRFRHSVFPCFIATTQRLLASSSTFPTCTFEACCFLRLHPKHSNSTTTPLVGHTSINRPSIINHRPSKEGREKNKKNVGKGIKSGNDMVWSDERTHTHTQTRKKHGKLNCAECRTMTIQAVFIPIQTYHKRGYCKEKFKWLDTQQSSCLVLEESGHFEVLRGVDQQRGFPRQKGAGYCVLAFGPDHQLVHLVHDVFHVARLESEVRVGTAP
mmetsp:Transcript_34555/g.70564  ORF Transcript_34555/g.70564 Transcript_34555/m.70564 type:complete len:297 (+) Transcript_34555:261-1151(+)